MKSKKRKKEKKPKQEGETFRLPSDPSTLIT